MAAATFDDVVVAIAALNAKVDSMTANRSSPDSQQAQQVLQALQQERQLIVQLQMEGYTRDEAVIYYQRMQKGEKPWLDPPDLEVDGKTPIKK